MHPFEAFEIPEGKVGIHWFGQSSFAFQDAEGTVVQVDPYFPRDRPLDRFIHAGPPVDEATLRTDFVILTHDHGDHTCMESLLRIHTAFPEAQYVGPPESVKRMREGGIPEALLTEVTAGDTAPLATMIAHAVWAKPPEGDPENGIKPPDVQHLGYVLEAGSIRIYISGDPIHTFAQHEELLGPIAAFQPRIGLLTTHPDEGEFPFFEGSVETALKLGLVAAVPSHYQCFVKRNFDPEMWAGAFPEVGPEPVIIPYNGLIVVPK